MPSNDFFLEFGSNADSFASKLTSELRPGVAQINALKQAILEYDEVAGSLKTSNPLGGMFAQLDQAAAKLEGVGDNISRQFAKITNSLGRLSEDLTAALDVVTRGAAASRSAAGRRVKAADHHDRDGEQLTADEAVRRAQQLSDQNKRRTAAARVTDGEMSAGEQRRTENAVKTATQNAREARNAVKRVADINATLATNATKAADSLKILGEQIRGLTTKTKVSTGGIEEGRFQNVTINVQGHMVGGGLPGGGGVDLSSLLAAHGVADAQQAPARDAAHQAEREKQENKRQAERNRITQQQWAGMQSQPAQPGAYYVGDEKQPRVISRRLNPGETYGGYFDRLHQNAQMLQGVRQHAITGSEGRVGPQMAQELQTIMRLIGRRGLEELHGPTMEAALRSPGDPSVMQQVRASVQTQLKPGRTLTQRQYELVPQALAEFHKMQEDFAKAARGTVTRRLSANPMETFAFPDEKRDEAFGQLRDFRDQVSKLDESGGAGAEYRAKLDAEIREGRLTRSARSGARRDLDNPNRETNAREGTSRVLGEGADSRTDQKSREFVGDVETSKAAKEYRKLTGRIRNDEQRISELKKLADDLKAQTQAPSPAVDDTAATSEANQATTAAEQASTRLRDLNAKHKNVSEQIIKRELELPQIKANNPDVFAPRGRVESDADHASRLARQEAMLAPTKASIEALRAERDKLPPLGPARAENNELSAKAKALNQALERSTTGDPGKALESRLSALGITGKTLPERLQNLASRIDKLTQTLDANVAKLGQTPDPRVSEDEFVSNARGKVRAQLLSEGAIAAGGGGGNKPPRNKRAAAAAGDPEDENHQNQERAAGSSRKTARAAERQEAATREASEEAARLAMLTRQVANRQGRVDRLMQVYEQAIEKAAAQYENLDQFNPNAHDEVVDAERKLNEARTRLAAKQTELAATPTVEEGATGRAGKRGRGSNVPLITDNVQGLLNSLTAETRAVIAAEKAALPGLEGRLARTNSVERAGTALKNDPAFMSRFGNNLSGSRQMLRTLLGLPIGAESTNMATQVFGRGGGTAGLGSTAQTNAAAAATQKLVREQGLAANEAALAARINTILASSSGKVQESLIAEAVAQSKLNRVLLDATATAEAYAQAKLNLSRASGRATSAISSAGDEGGGEESEGFLQMLGLGIGKSSGYALRHMIGFSLVFQGYDKLKEIVETGLHAQAAFVRLNAELNATHKSTEGVAQGLQDISDKTATPLDEVIKSASELTGVFDSTQGVLNGARVASGLSLLSQGEISPDKASIQLRNVVTAFPSVHDDPEKYADTIAHLQQITGVNVADIIEGATTLAQEAADFDLDPRQAAAISAFVTQRTGEHGEAAGEQTSRLLSTFYNGRVQNTLVANGVTDMSKFLNGDISGVLSDLVSKWEDLNPAQRQEIAGQVGGGRQARVFAALTSGGPEFARILQGTNQWEEKGAFQKQQDAYLSTIQGQIHQLGTEFKNIGDSLRRIGLFDVLGIAAKGFGLLAQSLTFVLNKVDDLEGIFGGFGRTLVHIGIAATEAVLGMRLLSKIFPGLGSNILGKLTGGRLGGSAAATDSVGVAALNRELGVTVPILAQFANQVALSTGALATQAGAAEADAGSLAAHAGAADADSGSLLANAGAADANAGSLVADAAAAEANAGSLIADSAAADVNAASQVAGSRGLLARLGLGFLPARGLTSFAGGAVEGAAGIAGAATVALLPFLPGAISGRAAEQRRNAAGSQNLDILGDSNATDAYSLTRAGENDRAAKQRISGYDYVSQTVINSTIGLGGLFHPAGETPDSGPSDKSSNAYLRLMQKSYRRWNKALETKDLDKIEKAYQAIVNEITTRGGDISKLGGNDAGSQAQIANALIQLRGAFAQNLAKQKANLDSLVKTDVELSQIQADMLGSYVQIITALTPNTLRQSRGATRALLDFSGASRGSDAYTDAAILAGYQYIAPTDAASRNYSQRQDSYNSFFARVDNGANKLTPITNLDKYGRVTSGTGWGSNRGNKRADGRYNYYTSPELDSKYLNWQLALGNPQGSNDIYRDRSKKPGPEYEWDEQSQMWYPANYVHYVNQPSSKIKLPSGGTYNAPGGRVPVFGERAPDAPRAPTGKLVGADFTPVQRIQAAIREDRRRLKTYTDIVNGIDPTTGDAIKNGQLVDPKTGKPFKDQAEGKKYTAEQMTAARGNLGSTYSDLQTQLQARFQQPAQAQAAQASQLANLGNYDGAAKSMKGEIGNLTRLQGRLEVGTQEFYANLQQIAQLRLQMAQTLSARRVGQLAITAANSLNPVAAARAQHDIALQHIQDAEDAYNEMVKAAQEELQRREKALAKIIFNGGNAPRANRAYRQALAVLRGVTASGGDTPAKQQAQAEEASANAAATQAAEAVNAAKAQANMAGIRNSKQVAQAQLNEALRQEGVYRSQGNDAAYYGAVAQEKQARISLRDAAEQQVEAAIHARAALASLHGDAVKASQQNLSAALAAYNYAVREYGKESQQAYAALAAVYQARQDEWAAELALQNSAIQLDAAQLTARGRAGDLEAAARDQVKEAQNAIRSYLSHGGKKNTAQYNQLQAQLVTAQRNAFDVALNAQLETLDFQKATYRITGAQEIASLQQILKNKNLTLAEQRAIILKIKGLQDDIRQQLTAGGLNIPSDIKLPTAYDVRRSLGAGFAGSASQGAVVNNNQTARVQINQVLPNAAVAHAVAHAVIEIINRQTGQSVRSNTSTPRNVPVGR